MFSSYGIWDTRGRGDSAPTLSMARNSQTLSRERVKKSSLRDQSSDVGEEACLIFPGVDVAIKLN